MRRLIDAVFFAAFMAAGVLLGAAVAVGLWWVAIACAAVVAVAWVVGYVNVATSRSPVRELCPECDGAGYLFDYSTDPDDPDVSRCEDCNPEPAS